MNEWRWNQLLAVTLLLYLTHLAEEALTGMHDDPLIAFAFTPLEHFSSRHATYLVFQIMLALLLLTTLLFGLGGKSQLVIMAMIGVALLAEGHHVLRACYAFHPNSGLITSVPMPFFGAYLLRRVIRLWPYSRRPL